MAPKAKSGQSSKFRGHKHNKNDKDKTVDWREYIISPIRYQQKDICWAVAIAAVIEARWNILLTKNKRDSWVSMSSQMLINILGHYAISHFKYVEEILVNQGLCSEDLCPFIGWKPRYISKIRKDSVATISGAKLIEDKIDEVKLMKLVAEGPVVGVIGASSNFKNLKKEDIYRGSGPLKIEEFHAVVIIGFGVHNDETKYWKIRNSYGENWCDRGYGKIIRESEKSIFVKIWCPKDVKWVTKMEH